MLFNVEVVSAEEYDAYLQDLEEQGNVGVVLGGSDATTQVGRDDEDQVQDDDLTGQGDAQ
jgi:cytochrome c oxidase subunit 2